MHTVCTVPADKRKILAEIGSEGERLNNTVHGVVAAAALELVLKQGHECDKYMEAVSRGKVQRLHVDVSGRNAADTQANADAVVAAVGDRCEVLELKFAEMARLHEGAGICIPRASIFGLRPEDRSFGHDVKIELK